MERRDRQRTAMRSGGGANRSAASANGWLVLLLLVLLAALLYKMIDSISSPLFNPDAQPRAITARGDLAADEISQIELFRQASPSVVHITTLAVHRDRFSLNLFEIPKGTGSGFIWDTDGHIVTNYHVIQGANVARATLADNTTWNARLVGAEPDKDLAVLKVEAPKSSLRPLPLGTSSDLQVGQKVYAIGNPFSLDQTLTTGVISGLGREIQSVTRRPIQDVIQTDAAINPGNSGGPLLDSAGRLIGINTAIYSPSGAYAGIGFAVPVDTVNRIVPQLLRDGKVERPGLGIYIFPDTVVDQLRSNGVLSQKGVLVRDVVENGAARQAGIRPTRRNPTDGQIMLGDLIVAIDEQAVENAPDLFRILEDRKVGDTVSVTVLREGQLEKMQVTLQSLPSPNP